MSLKSYLPLVREEARAFAKARVGRAEELERHGMIGLKKAVEMFDPDRAIPFEAFAKQRIRGAISDYLRTVHTGKAHAPTQPVPAALLHDIGIEASTSRGVGVEIWRAIEALPPNQKLVIGLHYCERVTIKDMGRILGVTEREAESLRDQALRRVHTHLSLLPWMDGERSTHDAAS
jgi:RNA polymerase sigma factor (sigma-70 family)